MFGTAIADAFTNPSRQPYLRALIAHELDEVMAREFTRVGIAAYGPFNMGAPSVHLFASDNGVWSGSKSVRDSRSLPYDEATQIYRVATGEELETLVQFDPMKEDYEELAKAGIQVWPPDGA
jgi:hypothetical protein